MSTGLINKDRAENYALLGIATGIIGFASLYCGVYALINSYNSGIAGVVLGGVCELTALYAYFQFRKNMGAA